MTGGTKIKNKRLFGATWEQEASLAPGETNTACSPMLLNPLADPTFQAIR